MPFSQDELKAVADKVWERFSRQPMRNSKGRPQGSSADEWQLYLLEEFHFDQDMAPFLAVQIAEAIDAAVFNAVSAIDAGN